MLNHIVVMGRLTKDPELRTTQSGTPVASFTVAVERDFTPKGQEKQTDFIDCVAWQQTGEFVSKYFRRGSMIVVEGSLQSRKWTDRDGNKRVSWEINADHSYFGEPKRNDGYSRMDGEPSDGYAAGEPQYTPAPPPQVIGCGAYGTWSFHDGVCRGQRLQCPPGRGESSRGVYRI